jgi:hypothetical protein
MLAGYGTLPFGFNAKELWAAIHDLEAAQEPIFIIPSMLEVLPQKVTAKLTGSWPISQKTHQNVLSWALPLRHFCQQWH